MDKEEIKETKDKIIEKLEEKTDEYYRKIEDELEEIYCEEVELGMRRIELENKLKE